MNEELIALLKGHATTDADVLCTHKDELLRVACQGDALAGEAAKALLRVELTTHDLAQLSEKAAVVADYDFRLSLYALLSQYNRVGPSEFEGLEAGLAELTDQRQYLLSIISMNCRLPWASPIVAAVVSRAASEQGGWHRHVHSLSCLLSYLDHPSLFRLAERVQLEVIEDRLLSATIMRIIHHAKKRQS